MSPMIARRPRVLLVDDEESVVFALYRVLYQDNARYDVLLAKTAEIARDILRDGPIDVLVTDVHLPGRSGMDLLGWAAVKAPSTRAIVMTAYDPSGIKDRAHASGCLRLVQKPFDAGEMREAILDALDPRDSIAGNLGELSIMDVVQMLCIARKSATLRVTAGGSAGAVLIDAGELIHAIWDDLTGEAAFERMIAVKYGAFSSAPLPAGVERTLHGDWQHLLIEGLRKLDEAALAPDAEAREPQRSEVRFSPFSIPPPAQGDDGWQLEDTRAHALAAPPSRAAADGRAEVARLIDEGFEALRQGRRDDARRAWEEALGLDPGNRGIELNLRKLDAKAAGQRR